MKIIFYIMSFLCCFFCKGKVLSSKYSPVKIDSIAVYKYFAGKGETTMGAWRHFKEMDSILFTSKIFLAREDVDSLQQLINHARRVKHFQHKIGIRLTFYKFFYRDGKCNNFIIPHLIPLCEYKNVISKDIEKRYHVITDLTAMVDYIISDPSHLEWLSNFLERVRHM